MRYLSFLFKNIVVYPSLYSQLKYNLGKMSPTSKVAEDIRRTVGDGIPLGYNPLGGYNPPLYGELAAPTPCHV